MADDVGRRGRGGLAALVVSTGIAGIAGYVIQLAAPVLLPATDDYVRFAAFWSALFLLGACLSGVQQELARATHEVPGPARSGVLRLWPTMVAATAAAAGVALWLGPTLFGGDAVPLTAALVIGAAGYLLLAALAGVLYGFHLWWSAAAITLVDAVTRLLSVLAALWAGLSVGVVGLAVALPFVTTFLIVFTANRRRLAGHVAFDVPARALLRNIAHSVLAALAMGVMITGLPLIVTAVRPAGADASDTASLVLAITLTRAPIVIPVLALQSYVTARTRSLRAVRARSGLVAAAGAVGVTAVVAGIAAWAGPTVVAVVSGGRIAVSSGVIAGIAASAVLVAALSLTGAYVLGRAAHRLYVAGWLAAAAATVAVLLVPWEYGPRVVVALLVGPVVGLVVYAGALARSARPSPVVGAQGTRSG